MCQLQNVIFLASWFKTGLVSLACFYSRSFISWIPIPTHLIVHTLFCSNVNNVFLGDFPIPISNFREADMRSEVIEDRPRPRKGRVCTATWDRDWETRIISLCHESRFKMNLIMWAQWLEWSAALSLPHPPSLVMMEVITDNSPKGKTKKIVRRNDHYVARLLRSIHPLSLLI